MATRKSSYHYCQWRKPEHMDTRGFRRKFTHASSCIDLTVWCHAWTSRVMSTSHKRFLTEEKYTQSMALNKDPEARPKSDLYHLHQVTCKVKAFHPHHWSLVLTVLRLATILVHSTDLTILVSASQILMILAECFTQCSRGISRPWLGPRQRSRIQWWERIKEEMVESTIICLKGADPFIGPSSL